LIKYFKSEEDAIVRSVENKSSAGNGGINFVGLLTILFIGLKLTNLIAWSWWWVLSPVWIVILMAFIHVILSED
jgi:hypothetical protein